MARYRKIDVRIWNDPAFQAVWACRWNESVTIPRSSPYPFPRASETKRMRQWAAWSTRQEFSAIRFRLLIEAKTRLGNRCVYCCARKDLVVDHVIPICYGGTNAAANIQPLCKKCNASKGGVLPSPPDEEA